MAYYILSQDVYQFHLLWLQFTARREVTRLSPKARHYPEFDRQCGLENDVSAP